jgi:BMFP domain-containing protein YqiC
MTRPSKRELERRLEELEAEQNASGVSLIDAIRAAADPEEDGGGST